MNKVNINEHKLPQINIHSSPLKSHKLHCANMDMNNLLDQNVSNKFQILAQKIPKNAYDNGNSLRKNIFSTLLNLHLPDTEIGVNLPLNSGIFPFLMPFGDCANIKIKPGTIANANVVFTQNSQHQKVIKEANIFLNKPITISNPISSFRPFEYKFINKIIDCFCDISLNSIQVNESGELNFNGKLITPWMFKDINLNQIIDNKKMPVFYVDIDKLSSNKYVKKTPPIAKNRLNKIYNKINLPQMIIQIFALTKNISFDINTKDNSNNISPLGTKIAGKLNFCPGPSPYIEINQHHPIMIRNQDSLLKCYGNVFFQLSDNLINKGHIFIEYSGSLSEFSKIKSHITNQDIQNILLGSNIKINLDTMFQATNFKLDEIIGNASVDLNTDLEDTVLSIEDTTIKFSDDNPKVDLKAAIPFRLHNNKLSIANASAQITPHGNETIITNKNVEIKLNKADNQNINISNIKYAPGRKTQASISIT